jgi:hypothetical protein
LLLLSAILAPLDIIGLKVAARGLAPHELAMIIISYNNICKGRSKPSMFMRGDDVDEESVLGVAAGL